MNLHNFAFDFQQSAGCFTGMMLFLSGIGDRDKTANMSLETLYELELP